MLAMGRALMAGPKLMMLDEPSMGLAPMLVEKIFDIVKEINAQGTTILLVEQNAHVALEISDRGYVLETGKVTLSDEAGALLENPHVRRRPRRKTRTGAPRPTCGGRLAAGIVFLERDRPLRGTTMTDIQLYSLEWCPYCIKAKALLKAKDIPYRETDVTHDREQALEMIERSGRNSVPQIFLDDEFVGGYDELRHLASTGLLDRLVGRKPAKLKSVYDVAVIGGGPAGLAAAMYAARKGLSTVLISRGHRWPGRGHPRHRQLPGLRVRHRARPQRADDRSGRATTRSSSCSASTWSTSP